MLGNLGLGTTPLSGGSASKWLTLDGTATYSGGNVYSINGTAKGYSFYGGDTEGLVYQGASGVPISLQPNGITSFRLNKDGSTSLFGTLTGTSANFQVDKISDLGAQVSITNAYGNHNGAVKLNLNNGGAVSWIKGLVTGPNTNGGSAMVFGVPSGTTEGIERMRIDANGNVGIGTSQPDAKLTVKGKIHAEEVKIDLQVPAPDYVFEKDYDLKPLSQVEKYITENKHLPEIPSAKTMASEGVNVAEMQMKLLQKIEELTLHLIEQNKRIKELEKQIKK